jgi:hypothetical protein
MSAETKENTEAVLAHHLQALMSRDLDELLKDYAPESILCTPNGTCQGLEGIRATFLGLLGMVPPEVIANIKLIRQDVNGEYAYILWSAAPAVPFGGDTFRVHDGKIVMQTFVGQMAP